MLDFTAPSSEGIRFGPALVLACLLALAVAGCGGGGGGGDAGTGGGASPLVTTGVLSGRVTETLRDDFTGELQPDQPVGNAIVTASANGTVIASAVSDPVTGEYVLTGLPVDRFFEVRISRDRFDTVGPLTFLLQGAAERSDFQVQRTQPRITSISPANLSTGIQTDQVLMFQTNLPPDPATLDAGVSLTRIVPLPPLDIPLTITASPTDNTGRTFTMTPSVPLSGGTTYGFSFTSALQTLPGSGGEPPVSFQAFQSRFSTRGLRVTTFENGPRLLTASLSPRDGDRDVRPDSSIVFAFDRAMDTSTVTTVGGNILFQNLTPPTTIDSAGRIVPATGLTNGFRYIPGIPFRLGNTFGLFITAGVKDLEGNRSVGESFTWTIRTDGPRVVFSEPGNQSDDIQLEIPNLVLQYDLAVNEASATNRNNYNFRAVRPDGRIDVIPLTGITRSPAADNTFLLDFEGPLAPNTDHSLFINNILDTQGNISAAGQRIDFRTTNFGDQQAPAVVTSIPLPDAVNVRTNTRFLVTFNEPMRPETLQDARNVSLRTVDSLGQSDAVPISSVTTEPGFANTFAFLPGQFPLAANTRYVLSFSPGVTDRSGNSIDPANSSVGFTTGQTGDTIPPRLLLTSPTNGATNVTQLTTSIRLVFDEPMDVTGSASPSSVLNPSNYRLFTSQSVLRLSRVQAVPGFGNAIFDLILADTPLAARSQHTLQLLPSIRDASGSPLGSTTGIIFFTEVGDITPPTVIFTFPTDRNLTQPVSVTAPFLVTFSEAMSSSVLDPANYLLFDSRGPVSITSIVPAGPANTFNINHPPLRAQDRHQLVIRNTLTDLAGNNLVQSLEVAQSVSQGAATTASSAISASVTGGVSINFTTLTSTVAAGNGQVPFVQRTIPSNEAQAVATNTGLFVTFSEAVTGATNPDNYRLFISGSTIVETLTVQALSSPLNSVEITPVGGLRAGQSYVLLFTSGIRDADEGNPLEAAPVQFTTVSIGDAIQPVLSSSVPAAGSSGFEPGDPILLSFSEAMDQTGGASGRNSALNPANYFLSTDRGVAIPIASVTESGGLPGAGFLLQPSRPLASETLHFLILSDKLRDTTGNPLDMVSLQFTTATTGSSGDVTPPGISNTNPANGSGSVSTDSRILITFSEPMDLATVLDPDNYVLFNDEGSIPIASITTSAPVNSVSIRPSFLATGLAHTLLFTSRITDKAGNALNPDSISFTVIDTRDRIPPSLLVSNPATGATSVDTNLVIQLTFSEPMDLATVTSADNYLLTTAGGAVPLTSDLVPDPNVADTFLLTPPGPLRGGLTYTLNITNRVKDANGNRIGNTLVFFTTQDIQGPGVGDNTAPQVVRTLPDNGSSNTGINTLIFVTFSEAVKLGSASDPNSALNPNNYIVESSLDTEPLNSALIKLTSFDNPPNTVLMNIGTLDPRALYTITFSDRIQDLAGNALLPGRSQFFTGAVDQVPPQPTNLGFESTPAPALIIQYSEFMENGEVLNTSNYALIKSDGSTNAERITFTSAEAVSSDPIPGSSERFISSVRLFFTGNLTTGTYTLFIQPKVKDLAGNPIPSSAINSLSLTVP